MADVELLDEFGNLRTIDETEVQQALAAGWRAEAPAETQARLEGLQHGTLGERAIGIGEQALSGASLGLSDVALAELGGDPYRARALARARELGGVAEIAKLGGALAPLVLTGGETAPLSLGGGLRLVGAPVRGAAGLGRAGEAVAGGGLRALGVTGESLAGRAAIGAAKLGAGGALEGAAFGAGQSLSEVALAPGGDYEHLAEKLMAGAEEGGKFGLFVGGGLGFLGGAGSRLIERGASKLVGAQGLKSLLTRTADQATVRALGELTPREAAILGESGLARMAREVRAASLDDGTKVFTAGATQEQIAERVARAGQETGAKIGALRRELSEAIEASGRRELRPDLEQFFNGVQALVRETETGPKSLRNRALRAQAEVSGLHASWQAGEATLEDVAAYRVQLDKVLRPPSKAGGIQLAPKNAADLEAVRGLLEESVESSIARASVELMPERAGEYLALKTRYGALQDANKLAKRVASREMARNRFSPFETLSGISGTVAAVAAGSITPAAAGVGIGAARKLWRTRGESVLAILAERVARAEVGGRGAIRDYLGRLRSGALGVAVRHEAAEKNRTARVLRQRQGETTARAYQRYLKKLQDTTPEKLTGWGEFAAGAPESAAAMAGLLSRGRQYLLARAPTSPLESASLQPKLQQPEPNPVMLRQWARRVEAAEDPLGSLKRALAGGSLTREHVETWKTLYPRWFENIRSTLSDELMTATERLPYQERLRLGMLMELPTDKSLEPRQLARTQTMYQQAAQAAQTPRSLPPQPRSETLAARYSTEAQRLEQNIPPA